MHFRPQYFLVLLFVLWISARFSPAATPTPTATPAPVATPGPPPGKPLTEAEAHKILDPILANIYSPEKPYRVLKMEFAPKLIDVTQEWLRRQQLSSLPGGLRVMQWDCMLNPLIYDPVTPRTARVVLYWKPRVDRTVRRNELYLEFYDAGGRRLDVHPYMAEALGWSCTRLFDPDRNPFEIPQDPLAVPGFWRRQWFLEERPDLRCNRNASILALQCHAPDGGFQNLKEIHFRPAGLVPLAIITRFWNPGDRTWHDGEKKQYVPLAGTKLYILGTQGMRTVPRTFHYTQQGVRVPHTYHYTRVGDHWVVKRVHGVIDALDPTSRTRQNEWNVEFNNIEIDPPVPDEKFEWPERPPVKLDLSTPDAAAQSVLACVRADREDLLFWCSLNPHTGPVFTRFNFAELSYRFKYSPESAQSLRIADKRQQGANWIYRIELLHPLVGKKQSAEFELQPKDNQWRLTEPNRWLVQLVD